MERCCQRNVVEQDSSVFEKKPVAAEIGWRLRGGKKVEEVEAGRRKRRERG
jgi:hypothetical protein